MQTSLMDLNLQYLAAEVKALDARLREMLRAGLKPGQDQSDPFQGLYISSSEARRYAAPAGAVYESAPHTPTPNTDLIQLLAEAQTEKEAIAATAALQKQPLRLQRLKARFGLSEFEYQAFLICLLPALDLTYERIYGFLQNDVTRKQAGADLILRLLASGESPIARLSLLNSFGAASPLIAYRLLRPKNTPDHWLEPRLDQLFEVPPAVVAWLTGDFFPENHWLALRRSDVLWQDVEAAPFAKSFELNWQHILDYQPILAFYGPDEDRRLQAARKTALVYGMPLLEVNLAEACAQDPFSLSMLRLLVRDACLHGAVTYIDGWERAFDKDGNVPEALITEMEKFGGLFILGSMEAWRIAIKSQRPIFQTAFQLPSNLERVNLWLRALGPDTHLSADAIGNVAAQFSLASGQIEHAAFAALSKSLQAGQIVSEEDLFQAARQQSSHHLGQLAQKVEARYHWSDIILPLEEMSQLHSLVAMASNRALVLEQWGLGKKLTSSSGVNALFTGDPGTGKTLAAQVVAAELHLDLYRIDLSTVVSKYIGETEKNLEKIFHEAQHSNAILFFDEADAIFGKRSEVKDAHDRYANIEVGYLLQRMEGYDGITILATNLRANIDEAFTRRMQFIIHFPFPEESQRLAIWKVLLPPGLPRAADIDWEFLARKYAIAGGSIRNVLVTAAFLAAQEKQVMAMPHLLQAARREMQKIGRLIKEEDYQYPHSASLGG